MAVQFQQLQRRKLPLADRGLPNGNTSGNTSGHSMGGAHLAGTGVTVDVGYVELLADFTIDARGCYHGPNGICGLPPD